MSPATLGLDIGGTNIKASVITIDNGTVQVQERARVSTPQDGVSAVMAQLAEMTGDVGSRYELADTVGLAFPGVFDVESGRPTVVPNLPGDWQADPLPEIAEAAIKRRVSVLNDARAFTFAEANAGVAQGHRNVLGVILGTGVGGGVILDGQLRLGPSGTAGELGHQTVVADGPACGCGNRGCVEAIVKASALAERANMGSAEEVYAAAERGGRRAMAAVAEVAEYLGIAIANAHALLALDTVVVGGGIASAGDVLLRPLRSAVAERVHLVEPSRVQVVAAALGSYAGAIGAGLWASEAERGTAR